MRMPSRSIVSVALGVLLAVCVAFAADPLSSSTECPYDPLPLDLTHLGLDFDGELHLQGTYYENFQLFSRDILFTVNQTSAFRFYVAPHTVDIDLWLYDVTTGSTNIVHTSDIGSDEAINATIPQGKYKVRMLFFGLYKVAGIACTTVTLEVQIVPLTTIQARQANVQCPATQNLPAIPFSTINMQNGLSYDTAMSSPGTVYNVRDSAGAPFAPNKILFFPAQRFTLPGTLNTDVWTLEATLTFDFITGGSLGILVQEASAATPTDMTCYTKSNCSIAAHTAANENTLRITLPAGDYNFYIYDAIGEKDFSLSTCTPFSLRVSLTHSDMIESFVNCAGVEFPSTLNAPGLMDDAGNVYYREPVLVDLSQPRMTTSFKVKNPSLFRAYTPEGRIDLDLQLMNADTRQIVGYTFQWGGEEGLVVELDANVNYNFTVIVFGRYVPVFCETFFLEIAIGPQTADTNSPAYCASGATTLPDLHTINDALLNLGNFTLGYPRTANANDKTPLPAPTVYTYNYQHNYGQKVILQQNFTVPKNDDNTGSALFRAELGVNFLLGDTRIVLQNIVEGDVSYTQLGEHRRNLHYLYASLVPGSYSLTIVTGDSQTTSDMPGFPSCTVFTFNLQIIMNPTAAMDCLKYRSIPASLNTPPYLGTSQTVHFQETFLVPKIPLTSTTEAAFFTVAGPSFFRAYSEPHHIDIDLVLYENNTQVAYQTSFNNEEALSYVVQPGSQYKLVIRYYHWFWTGGHDEDNACATHNLEAAIVPMTTQDLAQCTQDIMPGYSAIPTPTNQPFELTGSYRFSQGKTPIAYKIAVNVPAPLSAYFRAVITYDFVWDDLGLSLNLNNSKADPVIIGENNYNKNEIPSTILPPGKYVLTIYEPFDTSDTDLYELRGCVNFGLHVAIQLYDPAVDIDPNAAMCGPGLSLLPSTLNAEGMLSASTGQIVDFARQVVVDSHLASDIFQFTLATTSMFKIYIPYSSSVDVDVYLLHGTIAQPGDFIEWSVSTLEEVVSRQLPAGNYVVKFYYYGFGVSLPAAGDCLIFNMVLSIYPSSFLTGNPIITQACSSSAVPATITGNQNALNTYYRSLDAKTWSKTMTFQTSTVSQFTLDIAYSNVAGLLAVSLKGNGLNGVTNVTQTFRPLVSSNRAYLNEVLWPGTYTLTLEDPTDEPFPIVDVKCAAFTMAYYLNTSTNTLPVDVCDITQTLPTDLFSPNGGSSSYGGPQKADGSVRIYGDHFYMNSDAAHKHNYVQIRPSPSETLYARIWASADTGNDIDLYLYRNGSNPGSLQNTSLGWDSDESAVWPLVPQGGPYVLDVNFFRVGSSATCNYFSFELATKPASVLQQELLCPVPLPNEVDQVPPETVSVPSGGDFTVHSNRYLFTKSRITSNALNGKFRYRMTLTIATNASLDAEIGFDFLANDFSLVLSSVTRATPTSTPVVRQLREGVSHPPPNRNTNINFLNTIDYDLKAGTYYLDIIEDVSGKSWNFPDYCHSFSFDLNIDAEGEDAPARVLYVEPTSDSNLAPNVPLTLLFTFSESTLTTLASNSAILNQIVATGSVYLQEITAGSPKLVPDAASLDGSHTRLQLRFPGPFVQSGNYRLYYNASTFLTVDNVPFLPESGATYHMYRMLSCSCNGHGTCGQLPSGDYGCICQDPWTGADCSKCKVGTHAAADTCVPNTYCGPNTCSGHGTCDDTMGFTVCTCLTGYTDDVNGNPCAACAPGYFGYPNCTRAGGEVTDRGTTCTAPLIPSTLDRFGFLGFDGIMHLQDYYFVDPEAKSHKTFFQINQTSVMRVYTEPHWVDIDLWLYNSDETGATGSIVDYGISFGNEEVIYKVLEPGYYLLQFRYYIWIQGRIPSCETANLEWSIAPLTYVLNEVSQLGSCPANNNVPVIPGTTPGQRTTFNAPFTYHWDDQYFNVNARPSNFTGPNYFWRLDFTIPNLPQKAAFLWATVGYRFLQGDMSLMIESGSSPNHCKDQTWQTAPEDSDCRYGFNYMNGNVVFGELEAGDYTLWIYEPEPQNANVSACSLFNFDIGLTFVDPEQDVFNCDATVLPPSFDSLEYTDEDGFMHVLDSFLLNKAVNSVAIKVASPSMLRVSATSRFKVSLSLLDPSGNDASAQISADDQSLYATLLTTGTYTLNIRTSMLQGGCPTVLLEAALETVSMIQAHPPNCQRELLPSFPNPNLPIVMGTDDLIPVTYYASPRSGSINSGLLASYTFTATRTATIDVSVSSNFLRSDLRIVLVNSGGLAFSGTHDYNNNLLQMELTPDTYNLRIVRPPVGVGAVYLPTCTPFNFLLNVSYPNTPAVGDGSGAAQGLCIGDRVPNSFQGLQYLGLDGRMHVQSDSFFPAKGSLFFNKENVLLQVNASSIMRVYVEPHVVDIDVKLINNKTGAIVAQGSNAIHKEESFVYVLDPTLAYQFQVQYWFWDSTIPACSLFSMEVAIGPADALPKLCLNGGDRWPGQFPSALPGPNGYYYDSSISGENLYFQQTSARLRSTTYQFTLQSPSDVHFEVGYEFLRGAMRLTLKSASGTTYTGDNRRNRNVLNLPGLAAGQYTLTMGEVVTNVPQGMGCSSFNFIADINPYTPAASDRTFSIPQALDTIQFLAGSQEVHMQGRYKMFVNNTLDMTTFRITSQSVLRVECVITDDDNLQLQEGINVLAPVVHVFQGTNTNAYVTGFGVVLTTLTPGDYAIHFGFPIGNYISSGLGAVVAVEIAIDTVQHLASDVDGLTARGYTPTCATAPSDVLPAIIPDPDEGLFLFHSAEQMVNAALAADINNNFLITRQFTITRESIIYVLASFDFLTSDIDFELVQGGTTWYARKGRNTKELNEVIPAGTYSLQIFMPSAWPTSFGLDHCSVYSLGVAIWDAKGSGEPARCSALGVLPWELDDSAGGSVPYGGPLSGSGSIHLYGSFLVSRHPSDTIHFDLQQKSIVSVVVSESTRSNMGTSLTTIGGNSIAPMVTQESYFIDSFISTYVVNSAEYLLNLTHTLSSYDQCPSYQLQIDIKPVALIANDVACPIGGQATLPSSPPPFYNFHNGLWMMGETIESFIPSSALDVPGGFSYLVTFNTSRAAFLRASFGFNSLASFFSIALVQYTTNNGVKTVGRVTPSEWMPQQTLDGSTTVTQTIDYSIQAGMYALNITAPNLNLAGLFGGRVCVPFVYGLAIVPGNSLIPSIAKVNPVGAINLNPASQLSITVTFSTDLYTNRNQSIWSNVPALLQAMTLVGTDGTVVHPTGAQPTDTMGRSWRLDFGPNTLTPATSYQLKVTPTTLFDYVGNEVVVFSRYVYTIIDTSCNDHGTFQTTSGECVCSNGYAGLICDDCAAGFSNIGSSVSPVCVAASCHQDTCGCNPEIVDSCVPLGVCSISLVDHLAQCSCSAGFTGRYCGECAPGYGPTYPNCFAQKKCPDCAHGTCNTQTGQCECPVNFTGDKCDECAPDYGGENCSERKSWDSTLVYIEVTAVIVFVAAVAGFAVWFIRRRRSGATRYKMLSRFGQDDDDDDEDNEDNGEDEEGGRSMQLPVYDTALTEDEDPQLARDLDERARERDEAGPSPRSPVLNIQGDDEDDSSIQQQQQQQQDRNSRGKDLLDM